MGLASSDEGLYGCDGGAGVEVGDRGGCCVRWMVMVAWDQGNCRWRDVQDVSGW